MRVLFAQCLCLCVISASCVPWPFVSPVPVAAPTAAPAAHATAAPGHARPGARRTPRPLPTSAPSQAQARTAPIARAPILDGLLAEVLPEPNADYGVILEDLTTGARTSVNPNSQFPSASLYKLGVAWLTLRQVDAHLLSLDTPLTVEPDDAIEAEPDGGVAVGDTPTVREALEAMLSLSSNTAAHVFLRLLGRSAVNMEMERIGLSQTRVPDEGLPVTSAADMAILLRAIATSPELSAASRAVLLQCLTTDTPPDALRDTLPASIDIIDKTGNLEDASNVGALLASAHATVILVVVDHGVDPGDARGVIAQAGQVAYRSLLQ